MIYTQIQIAPVRKVDRFTVETCKKQEADFYTLYGRMEVGEWQAIKDYKRIRDIKRDAKIIALFTGLQIDSLIDGSKHRWTSK